MAQTAQPWFVNSPALFAQLKNQLRQEIRGLHLETHNGTALVRGTLRVEGTDGEDLDFYQIEILLPTDFPKSVPEVKEVGGKIPRSSDRHINEDGTACLFVRDETWKYWNPKTNLVDFINGPVQQFFLGQTFFAEHREWPFGQRSHYGLGIAEYYFEELGTKRLQVVIDFLKLMAAPAVDRRSACYCGSFRPLSDCHLAKVKQLRGKVPLDGVLTSLEDIKTLALLHPDPPAKYGARQLRLATSISIGHYLSDFRPTIRAQQEQKSPPMKTCGPPDMDKHS